MQSRNFIITSLRILPKCIGIYRKILKDETYHFNQLSLVHDPKKSVLERDVFGKRVIIQAVVGKNGSGKSSILEIMYRIINNFSYYIISASKLQRKSAEPIYLVEQLYADLNFIIDDIPCTLLARPIIGVHSGQRKVLFRRSCR